jgi:predicted RNA-binding Zn-ribbon protein involved in translation (DUF1610 family)
MKGRLSTDVEGNFEVQELEEGMYIVCPNCGHLNTYNADKAQDGFFCCENCGFQLVAPA